ncbi:threonine ammonia-lyase [Taklimakanibacter deserti]|uniref:threonine ammonia-lyase n=1 Tax=Taklimakanibacter deserti TaxID=2267839 RepID=UPI000E650AA1
MTIDIAVERFHSAHQLLGRHLRPSPLIELDRVASVAGHAIMVKAECLQPTGSFKVRGALHVLGGLSQDERRRGVIAYSTGNHAQAVAMAARRFGTSAVIVMSPDAPKPKIKTTRDLGAEILMAEPSSAARRTLAEQIAHERGLKLVPPFDDADVITGQGTIAVELTQQIADAAAVLVPIGGGGLISGIAAALKQLKPAIRILGVEPELENDAAQSFRAGQLVALPGPSASSADAIKVQKLGDLTFPLIQRHVDDVVTVTEEQIAHAMRVALASGRLWLEPAGAVALAAALAFGGLADRRAPLVAIGSGGNVDLARAHALIQAASQGD